MSNRLREETVMSLIGRNSSLLKRIGDEAIIRSIAEGSFDDAVKARMKELCDVCDERKDCDSCDKRRGEHEGSL